VSTVDNVTNARTVEALVSVSTTQPAADARTVEALSGLSASVLKHGRIRSASTMSCTSYCRMLMCPCAKFKQLSFKLHVCKLLKSFSVNQLTAAAPHAHNMHPDPN